MRPEPDWFTLEGPPRGVARRLVLPEAVVQHRAQPRRDAELPARTVGGRLPRVGLDQVRRLWLPPPPGRKLQRDDRHGRAPRRLRDQAIFFDQPRRRARLTAENV